MQSANIAIQYPWKLLFSLSKTIIAENLLSRLKKKRKEERTIRIKFTTVRAY